jgi:hypothetical protein
MKKDPRTIVRLEGLGELKKSNYLIGSGTPDLPVCSIVPEPTTLQRASISIYIYMQRKFITFSRRFLKSWKALHIHKGSITHKINNRTQRYTDSYVSKVPRGFSMLSGTSLSYSKQIKEMWL